MFARVVTGQFSPDKLDEAIQLWQEMVVPSVQQQKGFKNARFLVNRKTGKVTSMGLWETEADLLASIQWNQGQLDKFVNLVIVPPIVEHYELAGEV